MYGLERHRAGFRFGRVNARGSGIPQKVGLLLLLAVACVPRAAEKQPRTILAVFAHPDDEIFVGPLLAHYARLGVRVHLAVVTNGGKGASPRLGIPAGPELAGIRAEEVRCSCRELGIEAPSLLGFEDGELGRLNDPPRGYLAEVAREIRRLLRQLRPDVVITWGPEGGYGHPDHRLVGAVVTQLVQAPAPGAPSRLFYPGLPSDRPRGRRERGEPLWAPTDPRYLTVRVPYDSADLAATRKALACHKTQFPPDQMEVLVNWLHETLGGGVFLRPWFGASPSDDVLRAEVP
jgi:LmbE family N-acetylglucosaminyl deacetylase